jgi:NarL family two-component system response regulator LiaR
MTGETQRAIRLLICDDQAIVCEGLRAILESVRAIEVVGVANNGAEAIELTRTVQPDLVLMDLKMPQMNGVQATRAIREQFPEIRVLVLTTYDEDAWVLDAVRAGAAGYILKDAPQEELVRAIQATMKGWSPIDPQVAGKILNHVAHQPQRAVPEAAAMALRAQAFIVISQLSERERDVLRLLATGLSNTDIAQSLFLSEGTVKNYVSIILSKLAVADRTQAALVAIRAGLVQL